jgi:signal peptidase I
VHPWEGLAPAAADEDGDLPPFAAEPPPPSTSRTLLEIPVLLLIAAVVALVFKGYVAQAFFIPSESMTPTLAIGDRVVVSRLAYRLHDPRRGDLVVFDEPGTVAEADGSILPLRIARDVIEGLGMTEPPETEFIKRVIGLPGEAISATGGVVHINGAPLEEPYLPEGVVTDDFGPYTVPEDHVFVLGDNRSNSRDSRFLGPAPECPDGPPCAIPYDAIVGRAFLLLWPPSNTGYL